MPLAGTALEVTGHFKTRPDLDRPDSQIMFGPHSFGDSAQKGRTPEKDHGFLICPLPMRPWARGEVQITSRDPAVNARVIYDPFSDPEDCRDLVAGVRFTRKLAATAPLSRYALHETRPGSDVQTGEQIIDALRRLCSPAYHAAVPAAWGLMTGPSSTLRPGYEASRACMWWTCRSRRSSPPATPTARSLHWRGGRRT